MTLKSALVEVNHIVFTILSFSSKIQATHSMALLYEFGLALMTSAQRPSGTSENVPNQITMSLLTKHTGFHTA